MVIDEISLFECLYKCETSLEDWQKRTVLTIDMNQRGAAYLERLTIDVDRDAISPFDDDNYYLLLGWRPRESFLEFDCKTNSGLSMQLTSLDFRHRYMEWRFWKKCAEEGYEETIPPCWERKIQCAVNGIEESVSQDSEVCPAHTCVHVYEWEKLCEISAISETLAALGTSEPLIFCVSATADISILKVSERKSFAPGSHLRRSIKTFEFDGYLDAREANTTKIIAPEDMRFTRAFGYDASGDVHEPSFFGNHSWLHHLRRPASGRMFWTVSLTPRRSFFADRVKMVLYPSVLACAFWFAVQWFVSVASFDGGLRSIDSPNFALRLDLIKAFLAFPFGLLYSFYLTQIPIFYGLHERGFLYHVVMRPWYRKLAYFMVVATVFPFLSLLVLEGQKWSCLLGLLLQIFALIWLLRISLQFHTVWKKQLPGY